MISTLFNPDTFIQYAGSVVNKLHLYAKIFLMQLFFALRAFLTLTLGKYKVRIVLYLFKLFL